MKLSPVPFKTKFTDESGNLSHPWEVWFRDLRDIVANSYNESGDFLPKVYTQNSEPILTQDGSFAIWVNPGNGNAAYAVYRINKDEQVKALLT
jgi:hypothetical protein